MFVTTTFTEMSFQYPEKTVFFLLNANEFVQSIRKSPNWKYVLNFDFGWSFGSLPEHWFRDILVARLMFRLSDGVSF